METLANPVGLRSALDKTKTTLLRVDFNDDSNSTDLKWALDESVPLSAETIKYRTPTAKYLTDQLIGLSTPDNNPNHQRLHSEALKSAHTFLDEFYTGRRSEAEQRHFLRLLLGNFPETDAPGSRQYNLAKEELAASLNLYISLIGKLRESGYSPTKRFQLANFLAE